VPEPSTLDVSVVVPFADDEEVVGGLVRRVASHLGSLGCAFEIVCVDEGAGDNSVAVLKLLARDISSLRVADAGATGRGFVAGARLARGRVVWLFDAARAGASLAAFGWAHSRLSGDGDEAADVVHVRGRYLLCRRTRAWNVLDEVLGRGHAYERRFVRRARLSRLRVVAPPAPTGQNLVQRVAGFLQRGRG
jgi:glycosyltransferase involved in cell wall biosynthesis